MADSKITALPEATESDIELTDLVPVVDDVSTTPVTKKMTVENFRDMMVDRFAEKVAALTPVTEADVATTDVLYIVDNVVTTPVSKSITVENFRDLMVDLVSMYLGRAEILAAIPPATGGAPLNVAAGASSPAEQFPYYEFVNGSNTYRDFLCRLTNYNGGGLTLSAGVLRTSASAGQTYIFKAAVRRINNASEDLGASHAYDYNSVTVTVPAGPPAAGIPMAVTITFTDGADMDSLASGELFMLRIYRDVTDTATDTARLLTSITIRETL